jgi:hypothetical protein
MAGRFVGRKPFMKAPPRKPIYARPAASPKVLHGDEVILIEDQTQEEDEPEEYAEENKYFRFTSIRTLVWINFVLTILLIFSFILYASTRSPVVSSPSVKHIKENEEKEEPHRVYFNLVPDVDSGGKWTVVSLKSYGFNTESIIYLNVCCAKKGSFFCDPNWASIRGHDATIRIEHPDMIGSACRLIWLD